MDAPPSSRARSGLFVGDEGAPFLRSDMEDLRHHTHAPPLGLPSVNTCNFYFCQGTHERIASMFCHTLDPDPSPAIPQVPTHPHPSPPIPTHPQPSPPIPSHPQPSPYGLVQKSGGGGGGGGAGGGRARRASSSSSSSPKSGAGARVAAAAAKPRSSSGKNSTDDTAFLRQLV